MAQLRQIQAKIMRADALEKQVATWHAAGEKVVFTNGVFDLLHQGHIHYLAEAADLGQRLIIGLNADASVRTLGKGPSRPIKDQDTRALILASLQFVDAVCLFETSTPYDLIAQLKPDVLVKGGDYKVEEIAGHDVVQARGGEVIILQFLPGHSTTALEAKIRAEK